MERERELEDRVERGRRTVHLIGMMSMELRWSLGAWHRSLTSFSASLDQHNNTTTQQPSLTMDLPPLSEDILSRLLVSDLSPSELFDVLAEFECQAYLDERSINPELLSLFYSFYFFSHLILDQM